jgi:hypothetical protein
MSEVRNLICTKCGQGIIGTKGSACIRCGETTWNPDRSHPQDYIGEQTDLLGQLGNCVSDISGCACALVEASLMRTDFAASNASASKPDSLVTS